MSWVMMALAPASSWPEHQTWLSPRASRPLCVPAPRPFRPPSVPAPVRPGPCASRPLCVPAPVRPGAALAMATHLERHGHLPSAAAPLTGLVDGAPVAAARSGATV